MTQAAPIANTVYMALSQQPRHSEGIMETTDHAAPVSRQPVQAQARAAARGDDASAGVLDAERVRELLGWRLIPSNGGAGDD